MNRFDRLGRRTAICMGIALLVVLLRWLGGW